MAESNKTLQQDSISRSLSMEFRFPENKGRAEEITNEEKCLKLKRKEEEEEEEAKISAVETDADYKGSISTQEAEDNGRERLKRHRREVAGRVWIPEIWGQEELLKDWADCSAFDACLVHHHRIASARAALIKEARRANSAGLRIENRCL